MIILTGSNLGERQRELNEKVKEATAKSVEFDEIKDTVEESDVDKLFKIDLASKYLNVDYIIEVLKSGDSLFVSRALNKSTWIHGEAFSHIINVDNLHKNVIPFMSIKMKKKLLASIAVHVKNEIRAEEFYKYCMENQLKTIAMKFLNYTSENFKLEALKDKTVYHMIVQFESDYLKHFFGSSFTLAEAFIKAFYEISRLKVFRGLSFLYTVSDVKYLDLLEKYVVVDAYQHTFLGLRISKSIMKQHKDRVLKNPSLYIRILSTGAVKKYVTAEDARIYAVAVLPDVVELFWNQNYMKKYKHFLDKITVGKFQFVKQIFTDKYPEQDFETTPTFYHKQLYKLMTAEEKETWALKQIDSENEILGIGKDYLWYKFVSFKKAFEEIKKLVRITTDNSRRADMVLVLIESAKTQRDLEKLLKYYNERHANEAKFSKENFLDRILHNFNVFEFDEDCWTAFNKMFHNLEVYNITDYNSKAEFRIIALIYCIINKKEVPKAIKKHFNSKMQFYTLKTNTDKLTKEQQDMVFQYLLNFYMDEIKKFEDVPYEDEVKYGLRKYIHFTLDLLDQYDRTKEDCPELVNEFMKLDWSEFECHNLIRGKSKKELTKDDLMRDLKKDAKLLVEQLPLIKTKIDRSYTYDISTVLKKLKTYFSDDIAKEYLKFFDSLLTEKQLGYSVDETAAHGIFQLGDEKFKVAFMAKYTPKESKINHREIGVKWLRIQQAICAHACYSRPPVPLKSILVYIKGDYVHSCLPMFNHYLAHLPLPACIEFVEALLDTPVSIQKHGIRLAFECFDPESLNTVVLRAWKKTKNVTLRLIMYKAVLTKISKVTVGQDLLFGTLKTLTLLLNPDDDDDVFGILLSRLPDHLMPEFIEVVWKLVCTFPPKPVNLSRTRNVVLHICNKIDTIRQDFVQGIIEQFIGTVFIQEEEYDIKLNSDAAALVDAKWKLTATYIINIMDEDDIAKKLDLTKLILNKCLKNPGARERKRALLKTCFNFIHDLESKTFCQDVKHYENVNKIMQLVLETIEEDLPIEEIYMEVWEIRLGIVARTVIAESKRKYPEQDQINKQVIKEIANNFANGLGILINEFVEKEMFFTTFSSDIQNKIISKTQTLKNIIDSSTKFTDMMTYVCLGLMEFEVTQIYLLVLNLLPASCRYEYEEAFAAIVVKVDKMNNKEVRCNLFRKLKNPYPPEYY
ncbi:hypothetical protein PYW07_010460 [Mythimna separata]|uniref:Uncharacterized protein n=1 Tax=Mythimna separata TaxID=271217 RepID=A0AAD7YA60_MYTSE|nr:hypothetical protein PYW07_010460 [Mythimna separata]